MNVKFWLWTAVVVAAVGSAGSLYMSMGMGLKGCPLCFYQRGFIMTICAVLLMGGLLKPSESALFCLVSLPVVFSGVWMAAFHVSLVHRGILECPLGVAGLGTAPHQSLFAFALLAVPLLLGAWPAAAERGATGYGAYVGGILLGLLIAWLCIASVPKPEQPKEPYKEPPIICRPPYVAASTP